MTKSSLSASSSAAPPTPNKSSTSKNKTGRPGKWSASRQRKLARLYLYTNLPREDIPRVLKVENGNKKENWIPGKESTIKTVNSILDKEPRWLRPKDREDMDKKILGLSECKTQRKCRRQVSTLSSDESYISNFDPTYNFTETPLEDLLAFASAEPFMSPSESTTAGTASNYKLPFFFYQDAYHGEQIQTPPLNMVPNIKLGRLYPMYHTAEMPGIDEVSLLSTYLSITSLKKRLSQYSTTYVKAIARVVKTHSVSDSSTASTKEVSFPIAVDMDDGSSDDTVTIRSSSVPLNAFKARVPKLALPDSILVLDRHVKKQGACFPGIKNHDSKTCWCLDELDFSRDAWVTPTGWFFYEQFASPPKSLGSLDTSFQDIFGNTILHMLAAREADFEVILDALQKGVDGNAKNTAGQNFLHALSRQWITGLAISGDLLEIWLQRLNPFHINFFDRDVFGRSFFHILTHRARKFQHSGLGRTLSYLNVQLPLGRDAFDWHAIRYPKGHQDCYEKQWQEHYHPSQAEDPQQAHRSSDSAILQVDRRTVHSSTTLSGTFEPESLGATISPASTIPSTINVKGALINHHKRLLDTATQALISPRVEDSEGRNGLQCLAQASLQLDDLKMLIGHSSKRKRGQSSPSGSSKSLTFRYEVARTMLSFGVDPNNYDKSGNTVLMSFVTYLSDGEDDKALADLFRHLIQSGANVHSRNRSGETALHVAVRLGRKVATKILLERGANIHARTSEGKGVLRVGEMYYFRAREEPKLYASILACMALCIQYGAVATPSLVMEWRDRNSGFI